jgi:hypothetical protein
MGVTKKEIVSFDANRARNLISHGIVVFTTMVNLLDIVQPDGLGGKR